MKGTNKSELKNIGLQFFADPPANDPPASPPASDPKTQTPPTPTEPPAGKSYTQEQLNSMMANEKRTARQALLKELGFDVKDDKGFQDTLADIKKTLDAGKTQQQLDSEARKQAETAQKDAEAKAARLELKVSALSAGVKPECLDDVIALLQTKVNDTTTVEKALEGMKSQYPVFFGESAGSSGTGGPAKPPLNKGGGQEASLGKRLAQVNKAKAGKSSYFKN